MADRAQRRQPDAGRRGGPVPAAAALAAVGLAAQPWADRYAAALCLVVVGTLVHLAVRRVAVAIGLGWLGASVFIATSRIQYLVVTAYGPVAQLGAILAWVWLASPSGRSLAATRW